MQLKSNAYPALYDTYAGTPLVTSSSALPIESNESDAFRAVALKVSTAQQTDLLFSDRRNLLRNVGSGLLQVQGRFAHFSERSDGSFRLLHLVGGTQLSKGQIKILPAQAKYSATITSVDYQNLTATLQPRLPAALILGAQLHIFNDKHHASYRVAAVKDTATGSELTFTNPADVGELNVESLNGSTITSNDDYALSAHANRSAGLTAENESRTKRWRIDKTGNSGNNSNPQFLLSGTSVSMSDFTDTDGDGRKTVRVYDFGPGDTVELLTSVRLEKSAIPNLYKLDTNSAVTVTFPGTGTVSVSYDNQFWSAVPTSGVNGLVSATIHPSAPSLWLRMDM
jgi:hypothetical protein